VSRSQPTSKILGIDTSSSRCEIALADRTSVLAATLLPEGSKPTATLVPAIRDLCRQLGWSPLELDLVCVDIGPGSYTGLRVGLTCAKTFAFAAGAPLVAVGSLETVAQNFASNERDLEVAFDAARGQVFASRFQSCGAGVPPATIPPTTIPPVVHPPPDLGPSPENGCNESRQAGRLHHNSQIWCKIDAVRIMDAAEWARRTAPTSLVTGPALVKYRHLIPPDRCVADQILWWPRAKHVIELGVKQYQHDPLPSYWTLEPVYLRPSAAEEKLQM
jgi:tRNA threonylcarbamoyl adenosine modification protein YeaZ